MKKNKAHTTPLTRQSSLPETLAARGSNNENEQILDWYRLAKTAQVNQDDRPSTVRGVVLMAHGLNTAPHALRDWVSLFNRLGFEVLRISLRGHGEPNTTTRLKAFEQVVAEDWLDEVRLAYGRTQARAKELGVPHLYFGFSMGGLLGMRLTQVGHATFDHIFLVAPAIRLHRRVELGRLIPRFWGNIKSAAPIAWRANDATPAQAYNAFFDIYEDFIRAGIPFTLRRLPVTIFIDPNDELVSAERLRHLIDTEALGNWRIYGIHKSGEAAQRFQHHLAVAEEVVGKSTWQSIAEIVRERLQFEGQ